MIEGSLYLGKVAEILNIWLRCKIAGSHLRENILDIVDVAAESDLGLLKIA